MVYFAQDLENYKVKIGFTTDYQTRLKALQTGSPNVLEMVLVLKGGTAYEKVLHKKFKKYNFRGEWFTYCEEIRDFIKENLKNDIRAGVGVIPFWIIPFERDEKLVEVVKNLPERVGWKPYSKEELDKLIELHKECMGDYRLMSDVSGTSYQEITYRLRGYTEYRDSELSSCCSHYPNFYLLSSVAKKELFRRNLESTITLDDLYAKFNAVSEPRETKEP